MTDDFDSMKLLHFFVKEEVSEQLPPVLQCIYRNYASNEQMNELTDFLRDMYDNGKLLSAVNVIKSLFILSGIQYPVELKVFETYEISANYLVSEIVNCFAEETYLN
ncbi:MAG: hypothetical protein PHV95_03925 [Eubacteriales bacterium]|nr:hypothetical protein [Eubacteriales bacterium]